MFSKDFENFELRIKKLREESLEDFENAERVFEENYRERLEDIFPRDVLGVKKYIAGYFEIAYVDALESGKTIEKKAIFQRSVEKVIKSVPLSAERKRELTDNILKISSIPETLQSYFAAREDISRDPFFALVEDFSLDGDISREEFFILQQSYQKERDFIKALDSLPEQTREMFHEHIEKIFSHENSPKREAFESEYHQELKNLQKRGFNVQPVVVFVSRCYYKNPGKLKKYEHPKRRLRRTFKMALLKLLRAKLGNIDAEIFLKRFEEGEYFEDFFLLLYKLLEVVDENPKSEEIYSVLKLDEETQSVVYDAEKTKEKILEGEQVTASISNLIGETDAQLEEGILEKVLDANTHFHGEEIHFAHGDDMAGIHAEASETEEDDEDDIIDTGDTLRGNYERLKDYFQEIEKQKRKAFLEGNYDEIDVFNEKLMNIESKIEKIGKLLGEEL